MKSDRRLDDLFRAARPAVPDTARAEHAFETRLLARLREERGSSWSAWAWRLAPFCAALAIGSAVWCHSVTSMEADADTLLDAVRSGGGAPPMVAWWPEGEP